MAAVKPITPDDVELQGDFSDGIVRDAMRTAIGAKGIYDSVDFMLEQPGKVYKRGGWSNHSLALPQPPSMVGTIHIPTRVVAISQNDLYDVTGETSPQADLIGSVGFSLGENPTYSLGNSGRLILCDSAALNRPKKVYTTGALGTVTLAALGGTPPYAAHSAAYAGRIVLARGQDATPTAGDPNQKNRIWFSNYPDDESTWDTANKYIEATYENTGLAAIQGMLLVFSPRFMERIINGVPPGEENDDMQLQPVGGVGCTDARSIVVFDNQVLFASEDGAFLTEGVGFVNLMEKSDRSGILSHWRSLFVLGQVRSVVAGLLNRNYYFLSSYSTDGTKNNFMCYLPTRTWWRTNNTTANMFSAGATEQEIEELYVAMHDTAYVGRFSGILSPSSSNRGDPVGEVHPMLETRPFGTGPGLKAYGFARLTYDLSCSGIAWQASHVYTAGALVKGAEATWTATAGTSGTVEPDWTSASYLETILDGGVTWSNRGPAIQVDQAVGVEAESYNPVYEQYLPATTKADRARFRLFKDSQALSLRFTQVGESDQTELFLLEVEHRSYNLASDGE